MPNSTPTSSRKLCAALSLTLLALAMPAHAEDGFHGLIGAGVGYTPDYDGAKDSHSHAVLMPMLDYRKGAFEVSTRGGLRYWAVDRDDWKVAAVLGYDAGREEKRSNGSFGTVGSDRLRGMGKLDATVEAGVDVVWNGAGVPVQFKLMKAPGGTGHGGMHGSVGSSVDLLRQDKLQLSLNTELSFGDSRYNQAYHGVTATQAQHTAFREFHPKAGFDGVNVGLSARYQLAEHWGAMASVGYRRLLGDAANSPLTERKGTPTAMVGVGYQF